MCKLVKALITLIFLSVGTAFADSPYVLKETNESFLSEQAKSAIKTPSMTNSEVDILKLPNLVNKNLQSSSQNGVIVTRHRIPTEVLYYPEGKVYSESSYYFDLIDPTAGAPNVNSAYPGLRGANQLVLYTPSFGIRTNTNEFGAEATVVKNTVVKLGGADSLIPKDGFVISGHGKAKTWIHSNITLGTKIYLDPKTRRIKAIVTPDTYIFEANEKIKETAQVMQYYRMMNPRYDGRKASSYLIKANDYIRKAERHPEKTQVYSQAAKEAVETALQYAIPHKIGEFNGIWIRPVEHSPEEIYKTVNRLKEAGIKNIFLETYYHGLTIYPSEVMKTYGFACQRPEFAGFDPLRAWIDACHKNKIKVHIWFETFYVGNKPPRSSMKHILSVNPQWANTTKYLAGSNQIAYSVAEHNGYFLDPANPEVQKFVGDILLEIVEKYRPDGINLDYIRYPQGTLIKSDRSVGTEWGYTDYARNEFKGKYGVDPVDVQFSSPERALWNQYRQDKVTDFVAFARDLTNKYNMTLTAVIFPDRNTVMQTKMQDWSTWSKRNLVDAFTPLLLTTDKRTAGTLIHSMKLDIKSANTKLYPGIFVMFMDAPAYDMMLQLHEIRKMRADGVILFDYAHFKEKYEDALKARAFNHRSELWQK